MKTIICLLITMIPLTSSPRTAPDANNTITGQKPLLAGILNPALTGIKAIGVAVIYENALGLNDLLWADMKARAERKLAESDSRLAALLQEGFNARFLDPPLIRININKFFMIADGTPVFSVRTSFSANVPIGSNPVIFLRIDVWSRADTIQAPNQNAEIAAVNSLISKHIEEFVKDFSLANAPTVLPADVNNIKITPPQKPQTSTKPKTEVKPQIPPTNTQAQFSYIGSKNSKVFHKPDCTVVKNILPQNLVYYKTRDEAVAAGKRPCLKCKP